MIQYDKLVKVLLEKRAVSDTHSRLQGVLEAWATQKGYTQSYAELPDGNIPDVLRTQNNYLFIGDAKNAANETPRTANTVGRIGGYIREFSRLLSKSYKGGIIAIVTDDEKEANLWVVTLNVLALYAGITDSTGGLPSFSVTKIDDQAWVTWW